MKVTKIMREYIMTETDRKIRKKMVEFRKDYDERREKCIKEISSKVKFLEDEINEILKRYGMDSQGKDSCPSIIGYNSCGIRNSKLEREAREYNNQLRRTRDDAVQRFILECELGISKENFFSIVDSLEF